MGQIIINTPARSTLKYSIKSMKDHRHIVNFLEDEVDFADNPIDDDISPREEEELLTSLKEYEKTGKTYSWESIKKEARL